MIKKLLPSYFEDDKSVFTIAHDIDASPKNLYGDLKLTKDR